MCSTKCVWGKIFAIASFIWNKCVNVLCVIHMDGLDLHTYTIYLSLKYLFQCPSRFRLWMKERNKQINKHLHSPHNNNKHIHITCHNTYTAFLSNLFTVFDGSAYRYTPKLKTEFLLKKTNNDRRNDNNK